MTNPTADAAKLLPCPFCGASGTLRFDSDWWVVQCNSCTAQMGSADKDEASIRWNSRPQPAPVEGEPDDDRSLAAQLVEARGQLRYQRILTEQIQTSHDLAATTVAEARGKIFGLEELLAQSSDIMRGYLERAEQAEAAAASTRETALEEAATWVSEQDWPLYRNETIDGAIKSRAWIRNAIRDLKSTPPAPVTLSATKEVMPDTSGSRSNSGDTATPQASTLAPGANAPEPDFDAIAAHLRQWVSSPDDFYECQAWVATELERMYRLGLTRVQGGKT